MKDTSLPKLGEALRNRANDKARAEIRDILCSIFSFFLTPFFRVICPGSQTSSSKIVPRFRIRSCNGMRTQCQAGCRYCPKGERRGHPKFRMAKERSFLSLIVLQSPIPWFNPVPIRSPSHPPNPSIRPSQKQRERRSRVEAGQNASPKTSFQEGEAEPCLPML